MKTKLSLSLIAISLASQAFCQTQLSNWHLFQPNQSCYNISFTGTNIPALSTNFTQQLKQPGNQTIGLHYASNVILDNTGAVALTVINTENEVLVFDKTSQLLSNELAPLGDPIDWKPSSEINISPLSCGRYLITTGNKMVEYDAYKNVFTHANSGNQIRISSGHVNIYSSSFGVRKYGSSLCYYGLEASLLGGGGNRKLCKIEYNESTHTATTTDEEYIGIVNGVNTQFYEYTCELEISPNGQYLAFADNQRIFIYSLTSTGDISGLFRSYTYKASNGPEKTIGGLEFSSDNQSLVFSTMEIGQASSSNDQIGILTLSSGNVSFISNSSAYARSQIELGRDGKLYTTSSTGLYSIDIAQNTINAEITGLSIPYNFNTSYNQVNYCSIRTLPDQLDGQTISDPAPWLTNYTASSGTAIWTQGTIPLPIFAGKAMIGNKLIIPAGANITIQDLIFEFAEIASVEIKSGGSLTLQNTYFKGIDCRGMWSGISVEDGGTLIMKAGGNPISQSLNSKLADAITGVKSNGLNAKVRIEDFTTFSKNQTHLEINNGPASNPSTTNNIKISGAKFWHTTPLKENQYGTTINGQNYGTTSIKITNPATNNNTIEINNCEFLKGQYAVFGSNSSIKLQSNNITGIGNCAVIATGPNTTGNIKTIEIRNCNFDQNIQHIRLTKGINAQLENNYMSSSSTRAIEWSENKNCKLIIGNENSPLFGNTIQTFGSDAIYCANNAGISGSANQSEIIIGYNSIINQPNGRGIYIGETAKAALSTYKKLRIKANLLSNINNGIFLQQLTGYQTNSIIPSSASSSAVSNIEFNTINTNFYAPLANYAIKGINTSSFTFLENTITSNTITHTLTNGIVLESGQKNLVKGNIIKSGIGYLGKGNMTGSNYLCNQFNQNIYGIYLQDHILRSINQTHGIKDPTMPSWIPPYNPNITGESRHNRYYLTQTIGADIYLFENEGPSAPPALRNGINDYVAVNKWVFTPGNLPQVVKYSPRVPVSPSFLPLFAGNGAPVCLERAVFTSPFLPPFGGNPDPPSNLPLSNYAIWEEQYLNEAANIYDSLPLIDSTLYHLIVAQQHLANKEYETAEATLVNIIARNSFEQQIIDVCFILLTQQFPEERPLNTTELSNLSIIANLSLQTAGPAKYMAMAILFKETGFDYMEPVANYGSGIWGNVQLNGCLENEEWKLYLRDYSTSSDLDVINYEANYGFSIEPDSIIQLDSTHLFGFILRRPGYPEYIHPEILNINDWLNYSITNETNILLEFDCIAAEGITLGIANGQTSNSKILITPNPAHQKISFNQKGHYEIYSYDGKLMAKGITNDGDINIEVLKSGIYLIKLSDTSGNVKTGKFIKN